jgi:hypothetical protein
MSARSICRLRALAQSRQTAGLPVAAFAVPPANATKGKKGKEDRQQTKTVALPSTVE